VNEDRVKCGNLIVFAKVIRRPCIWTGIWFHTQTYTSLREQEYLQHGGVYYCIDRRTYNVGMAIEIPTEIVSGVYLQLGSRRWLRWASCCWHIYESVYRFIEVSCQHTWAKALQTICVYVHACVWLCVRDYWAYVNPTQTYWLWLEDLGVRMVMGVLEHPISSQQHPVTPSAEV